MIIKNPYQYVRGEQYPIHFDHVRLFTSRPYRKHRQACKNASRSGLRPRRRKYWERVARRTVPFYYATMGAPVGNYWAVTPVNIQE